MSFGIAGCHGSGKTTLAKALAETLGFPFFETKTTEVAKSLGFDPVAPMSIEDRMTLQEGLLENHWKMTQELPRPFICDRTPVDYLAYMLAEVSMTNTTPEMGERIARYVERAMWVATNTYMSILITRPLDNYEVDPKRPALNLAYQHHFQTLVEGTAFRLSYISRFVIPVSDHGERMAMASNHIAEVTMESIKRKPTLH